MNWIKKNINGILGTIIFHLVILLIAMVFEFRSQYQHVEHYTLIEAEFLEEPEEVTKSERRSDIDEVGLEQVIENLRNVGVRQAESQTATENIESMSLEEIRAKYEEQILREKYGDEYYERISRTYEDFIDDTPSRSELMERFKNLDESQIVHSGPALVFVELENEDRATMYVHVPVFTCREGGVVVIDITIRPDGSVSRAGVQSAEVTGGTTDCIVNEARNSALNSRFAVVSGGETERGTITYHFIPQ